mmetsp:Transcript_17684/g.27078  ORF Transcript_17684/g.27078 Transcript_17684/m.27078 type:complete len:83 (+) Transcript_17684:983-1231(+)
MKVRIERGDRLEEDVSCDSTFMLEKMPLIGAAIRSKMNFVPPHVPIRLFLDNAGGHGTIDAIAAYRQDLERSHNVLLSHQPP